MNPKQPKILSVAIICVLYINNTLAQGSLDTLSYLKNNRNVYSIIVAKQDQTVFERYYNGYDKTTLFNNQSITKSICSLLVGIAIDKGFIKSVDEKLANYFPELRHDSDRRKNNITIRQLMNQASGLYHEDLKNMPEYFALTNQTNHVLEAPLVSEPGKIFHYNNAATHLLSALITKSTGMETHFFAKKYLFGPLGITAFEWPKMPDGYDDGGGLLSVRLHTADLVKIGRLLLSDGSHEGHHLVSKAWIGQIRKPTIYYQTEWGFDNSTYSLCWYQAKYKGSAITYAMGWGGQFLIIIPSLKSIIAINQNTSDDTAIKQSINFINVVFPLIYQDLLVEK